MGVGGHIIASIEGDFFSGEGPGLLKCPGAELRDLVFFRGIGWISSG